VLTDRHDSWSAAISAARMTATVGAGSAAAAIPADDLARVLDVLLSNAVQYAGPGAHVDIGATEARGEVRIWVADSGRGAGDDELPQLTDRFFRGADAPGPGTGLGLAIARALVERAGGELSVGPNSPTGLRVELRLHRDGDRPKGM
jgi:signal transduction histidine kinase